MRRFFILFLLITILISGEINNETKKLQYSNEIINNKTRYQTSASDILILFYQRYISPINQKTCQMYPSCSVYGKNIMNKYGLSGFFMVADRLNRCGHDLNNYIKIIVKNKIRYYDPVK